MENDNQQPLQVNPDDVTERQSFTETNAERPTTLTGNIVASRTRNPIAEKITANIVSTGPNAHIDMRGSTIIIQQETSGTEGSQNAGLKENKAKDFLEVMKKYVLNETKISITSTYHNLNEMDPKILPSMGVVDFTKGNEAKISKESGDIKDTRDDIDFGISDIKLSQLHDSYKGQTPKRVFLLGDPGSGKTTAAKLYARMVLDGEVESLKDIELVHFISISDLQQTRTNAFDLLVSRQVGLDEKTEVCGEKWLAKNASKTLFVLDGLDQSAQNLSGKYPKVAKLKAEASTNEILANILYGVLYPGLNILVTSRQNAFWKLDHNLRSSKTVVLRGFSDQNLKNAANTLAGGNEGDKIIGALRNSSLLSLCQTPMFLIYAINEFKKNVDKAPDTITALMSAVFMHFEESDNWKDDFQTLTKLAYHATIDNRFTFTEKYVRDISIDPSKLGGLLTPHIRLLHGPSRSTTGNTTWSFPHQTLQEFFGALGIFDVGQDKFERFVENELNKTELQIVRKFVYGMVLNPATRKVCEPYLTDKSVSLEACKTTLMKQLDKFLAKGVIDDIDVISLLHECGPDMISHYKSRINRINTNENFPKPEDEHSLMSVAKQCVPMKEIRIQHMEMKPLLMEHIRGFIQKVDNFKICTMTIGKHITNENCRELTDLVPQIKVNCINLWTAGNIASTFLQTWIDDKQAPCKNLWLVEQFSNDTFRTTGRFLSELGADFLCFTRCSLTKEKFEVLCESMEKGAKLHEFYIYDDAAMAPEVYEDLTMFLNKGCVETLILGKCGLTDGKLTSMNNGINRNKVKLQKLLIFDDDLDRSTMRQLPRIVTKTQLMRLGLFNCKMTEAKFDEMADTARMDGVQIQEFYVSDKDMDEAAYHGLGRAVGKAQTRILVTDACNMTEKKLEAFGGSAKANNAELQRLSICNEDLDRTTMSRLPTVVTKTQLTRLVLSNCKMTEEKFDALADAAKTDGIQIQEFEVSDKEMDEAAYHGLGRAVGKAQTRILLIDACNMTEKKLEAFGGSAKANNAELQKLLIFDDDLDRSTMRQLPRIVTKTQLTRLGLFNCKMTEAKFDEMADTARMDGVQIQEFFVTDKDMDEAAYHALGRAVGKAQTRILVTDACNMTEKKLEAFGESAKANNAEFEDMSIWNDPVDAATLREFAKTIKTVNANIVALGCCQLTAEKLGSFKQAIKLNNVKFKMLEIYENMDLDDECYNEIVEICKDANADLQLSRCNVPHDRVRMLKMHIRNVIVKP